MAPVDHTSSGEGAVATRMTGRVRAQRESAPARFLGVACAASIGWISGAWRCRSRPRACSIHGLSTSFDTRRLHLTWAVLTRRRGPIFAAVANRTPADATESRYAKRERYQSCQKDVLDETGVTGLPRRLITAVLAKKNQPFSILPLRLQLSPTSLEFAEPPELCNPPTGGS